MKKTNLYPHSKKKWTWLNYNCSFLTENERVIIGPLIVLPGKILRSTCIGGWTVQKHRQFPPLSGTHSGRFTVKR